MQLKDRVALVTGAASGIGKEIARKFITEGARVAIADLDHNVVEFWRVPYDIAAVQERMRAAHLPEPLVQRLVAGR